LKRAFGVLFLAAVFAVLTGGPANANAVVTTNRLRGPFATAFWSHQSDTTVTSTALAVFTISNRETDFMVDQFVAYDVDADGNFSSVVDTSAAVTSGFRFAVDGGLRGAAADATGLPATRCTYDASFNLVGCVNATIDVHATWTGQGTITRGEFNLNLVNDTHRLVLHGNGSDRLASATSTVNGNTMTADDLTPPAADLGFANSVTASICVGVGC